MISLVTMTADKPLALQLCEAYVARMRVGLSDIEWIVADGGQEKVPPPAHSIYIRTEPYLHMADNMKNNFYTALDAARGEIIMVIEDDDWYHPNYISYYLRRMNETSAELYGEGDAKYYNIRNQTYHLHKNKYHASLCQTAFRKSLIPKVIEQVEKAHDCFFDLRIWRNLEGHVDFPGKHSVGIKALPGRIGVGTGHKRVFRNIDPEFRVLKSWVGSIDTFQYQRIGDLDYIIEDRLGGKESGK